MRFELSLGVRELGRLPEPVLRPRSCAGDAGLNCAGYGASMCMTASFGLRAAARLIERLSASGR